MAGGEPVILIGFPGPLSTPWTVTTGSIGGLKGRELTFQAPVDEGNSGGPLLTKGKVVGVIAEAREKFGYAVPAPMVQLALKSWQVRPAENPEIIAKEITGKDGAPMVLVPAGVFKMGSLDMDGPYDQAERKIFLDAFYMDKYEVTVSRYAKFLEATGLGEPDLWDEVSPVRDGDRPVVGVDWHDADVYCRWANKRLPTEAEWEKAARGTDGRKYPWGNEKPTSRHANFGSSDGHVYESLAPVGGFQPDKSPYGIYDLGGNVNEWVSDWYDEDYYSKSSKSNPSGPSQGQKKVLRGGSWIEPEMMLQSAARFHASPKTRHDFLGFRCAQDAPRTDQVRQ